MPLSPKTSPQLPITFTNPELCFAIDFAVSAPLGAIIAEDAAVWLTLTYGQGLLAAGFASLIIFIALFHVFDNIALDL